MNIFEFREAYPSLIKSQTAERQGIDNRPTDQRVINNLENLWVNVICPIAKHFGPGNFLFGSGYRCLDLNRFIGSADSSQHIKGQAVDFEIDGKDNHAVYNEIPLVITQYDQLILEFYDPARGPRSGWIHLSYNHDRNRNQKFKITKKKK